MIILKSSYLLNTRGRARARAHTHTHARTHTRTHAHTHARTYTHTRTHAHTHARTHARKQNKNRESRQRSCTAVWVAASLSPRTPRTGERSGRKADFDGRRAVLCRSAHIITVRWTHAVRQYPFSGSGLAEILQAVRPGQTDSEIYMLRARAF